MIMKHVVKALQVAKGNNIVDYTFFIFYYFSSYIDFIFPNKIFYTLSVF